MEIKVKVSETFTSYVMRESITIKTEDYPELEGMSESEVRDYIRENLYDMAPPKGYERSCNDLYEALHLQQPTEEEISDDDYNIHFI